MKKKDFTIEYVRDWWLLRYHNTTCAEVAKNYPKEAKSGKWLKIFAVTQDQHDEWYKWFIGEVCRLYKWSKKRAKNETAFTYLEVSLSVKKC